MNSCKNCGVRVDEGSYCSKRCIIEKVHWGGRMSEHSNYYGGST